MEIQNSKINQSIAQNEDPLSESSLPGRFPPAFNLQSGGAIANSGQQGLEAEESESEQEAPTSVGQMEATFSEVSQDPPPAPPQENPQEYEEKIREKQFSMWVYQGMKGEAFKKKADAMIAEFAKRVKGLVGNPERGQWQGVPAKFDFEGNFKFIWKYKVKVKKGQSTKANTPSGSGQGGKNQTGGAGQKNKGGGNNTPSQDGKGNTRPLTPEQKKMLAYLRKLPEHVKLVIKFTGEGKAYSPEELERLYRLAKRVESMDPDDLRYYTSQASKETTDIAAIEQDLDRFIANLAARRNNAEDMAKDEIRMLGLEQAYGLYRQYKKGPAVSGRPFEDAPPDRETVTADQVLAAIQPHGFATIAEFEAFIHGYQAKFEKEAAEIAFGMIHAYEMALNKEAQRLRQDSVLKALHAQLAGWRGSYKDYQNTQADAGQQSAVSDAKLSRLGPQAAGYTASNAKQQRAKEKKDVADGQLNALKGGNLILEDGAGLNRDQLAAADSPDALGQLIQGHVQAKTTHIRGAKAELRSNPLVVYQLDQLWTTFLDQTGCAEGSLQRLIVQDKKADLANEKFVKDMLLLVIGLGLAVASGGTASPLLAFLVAAGAAGVAGYGAYAETEDYLRQRDFAEAGIADDPSIAWAALAIAGAIFEVGAFAKLLSKGVKAIAPAARTFNTGGNLERFSNSVDELLKSGDITDSMAKSLKQAALAESQYRVARERLSGLLRKNVLYSGAGPAGDPEFYGVLYEMAKSKLAVKGAKFKAFYEDAQKAFMANSKRMDAEDAKLALKAWEDAKATAPKPKNATGAEDFKKPGHSYEDDLRQDPTARKPYRTEVDNAEWVFHQNGKHYKATNRDEAISLSIGKGKTKSGIKGEGEGNAQYFPREMGRTLETLAIRKGIVRPKPDSQTLYFFYRHDQIVGYDGGEPTYWLRAEITSGSYHGHPISAERLWSNYGIK